MIDEKPNSAESMVERVARAIAAAFEDDFPGRPLPWSEYTLPARAAMVKRAIAAIEAMREPTPAIIDAVSQELRRLGAWDALPGDAAEQIIAVMIDAAIGDET